VEDGWGQKLIPKKMSWDGGYARPYSPTSSTKHQRSVDEESIAFDGINFGSPTQIETTISHRRKATDVTLRHEIAALTRSIAAAAPRPMDQDTDPVGAARRLAQSKREAERAMALASEFLSPSQVQRLAQGGIGDVQQTSTAPPLGDASDPEAQWREAHAALDALAHARAHRARVEREAASSVAPAWAAPTARAPLTQQSLRQSRQAQEERQRRRQENAAARRSANEESSKQPPADDDAEAQPMAAYRDVEPRRRLAVAARTDTDALADSVIRAMDGAVQALQMEREALRLHLDGIRRAEQKDEEDTARILSNIATETARLRRVISSRNSP
jgi:hypothetical protein